MKLKLQRRFFGDTYTIGTLFINGTRYCDTLEDKNRDLNRDGDLNDPGESKVMHKTAIPFGTYEVIVAMSPRFKRELPRLLNVPHFDGILIHAGNTPEATSGCILVGENTVKGQVVNSRKYEADLVKKIKAAMLADEEITIEII